MSAHLEWNDELGAEIVVGAEGRRHCEIGELPKDVREANDPTVNLCFGCRDETTCAEPTGD